MRSPELFADSLGNRTAGAFICRRGRESISAPVQLFVLPALKRDITVAVEIRVRPSTNVDRDLAYLGRVVLRFQGTHRRAGRQRYGSEARR